MVAIAIFSADPVRRRSLEEVLRGDSTITIVGVEDDPAAVLRLIDQNNVDAVLADAPTREHLADWRNRHGETAFVVLVDGTDEEDSLDEIIEDQIEILKERGFVRPGDVIVNTGSTPVHLHLPTNVLKITKVE